MSLIPRVKSKSNKILQNKIYYIYVLALKSLGPIDRKFYGHGKNDEFVLYEYIIKQCSSFCKHTNISVMKKWMSNKITCQQ